jgi:hypothetical protein
MWITFIFLYGKLNYICIVVINQTTFNFMNTIKTLEYSMDYSQECEDFTFEVLSDYGDREDHSDDVTYKQVTDFINSLVGVVNEFFLSEDRTEGTITWFDNGTMSIRNRIYNSPDWSDFDEDWIENIPSIDFSPLNEVHNG